MRTRFKTHSAEKSHNLLKSCKVGPTPHSWITTLVPLQFYHQPPKTNLAVRLLRSALAAGIFTAVIILSNVMTPLSVQCAASKRAPKNTWTWGWTSIRTRYTSSSTCMFTPTCTHLHACTHLLICTHLHVCRHLLICTHLHVCTHWHVCPHLHVCTHK